jgi:hypothetical protein
VTTFRSLFILAAIVAVLVGMSGSASATNLVLNPNFDITCNSDSSHSGQTDPLYSNTAAPSSSTSPWPYTFVTDNGDGTMSGVADGTCDLHG